MGKSLIKVGLVFFLAGMVSFACSEQDAFSQCIECNGVVQVCEGADDGNGGIITRRDLEEAIADGTYAQSCQIIFN